MVKCFSAFLDFCFIAHHNAISAKDLNTLQDSLHQFHHSHNVFIETGVHTDISLPHQHSLIHYFCSIHLFGSLNGLCSSITESKHIKAVKKPWQRLNQFCALVQMLRTILQLDKLEAHRCIFAKQGMMEGSTSSYTEISWSPTSFSLGTTPTRLLDTSTRCSPQWMPMFSWSYQCLSLCCCLLLCPKWSVRYWGDVSWADLIKPKLAWGVCTVWYCVCGDWCGAPRDAWHVYCKGSFIIFIFFPWPGLFMHAHTLVYSSWGWTRQWDQDVGCMPGIQG